MKYDVVMIGGGPAGLSSAVYAARAGCSAVVLEGAACGGQMLFAHEIENYPGTPKVSGMQLADTMTAQAESFGVPVLYKQVHSLQALPDRFRIDVGGEELYAKAVVVASGSEHRKLNVPGEDVFLGRGVSYCAVCDGRFFRGKDAVVVGGGNTALGDAIYLSELCRTVTVVHRRDSFRADRILVDRLSDHPNVKCLMKSEVVALEGDSRLERIQLRQDGTATQAIDADCVFIAVGNVPRTDFVQELSGLQLDGGYIVTDERCRTSVQGLFAAGDVRAKSLRQIVTAVSDGAIAGTEAAAFVKEN